MTKRTLTLILTVFLAFAFAVLTTSCAKKVVQTEMAAAAPQEQPKAKPEPVPAAKPQVKKPVQPTETTISEEELRRRAEAVFVNQHIHFDFDKYDLKAEAREILADKAHFMKKYSSVKILIEGHCDERGTNEYNLGLGDRRANSAKQYLIQLGIAESRIDTVTYGEERPLDAAHNEKAWSLNRRDQFVIAAK